MRASTAEGQHSSHSSRDALRERSHLPPGAPTSRRRGGPHARYLLPAGVALVWLASMLLPLPNLGTWLAHPRPPAATTTQPTLRGTTLDGVPAPDFQLQDQNGQPISLAQFRGQPVVLTFFDSVCPHAECSLMAQYLEWSAQFLGAEETSHVSWVALSVNPWHDTPATARAFLTSHKVTLPLHYVLGSVDQMSALWKAYHMQAILQSDGIVIHTTGVYVLDGQGRERVYFNEGFDPHDLSADLRTLLAQGGAGTPPRASASGTPQAGTRQTQTVGGDQITLAARPGQFGTYTFDVTLADARGEPITGATVSADLTMTEMVMQPEHVLLAPQGSDGTYTADGVLTMAGRWRITLHIQQSTRPQVLPGLPAVAPAPLAATFDFTARY